VKLLPDRTEKYSSVLASAARFIEQNIDIFVEEQADRDERRSGELLMERGLGQLQLNVLQQLLAEEIREISLHQAHSPAESQFMLGKEEGLKRAEQVLKDLMDRAHIFYRRPGA
jgi:hypothetical protein